MSISDCELINAFVVFMQKVYQTDLRVDRWPDKENDGDIDAIAGNFALEHTSIDTLPNQRRDSDWFMKAVGNLRQDISFNLPFRLRIILEYDAVKKGQNWAEIRDAIKNWATNEAVHLKDGRHVLSAVPGVPFRLLVTKASDRPSALIIGRLAPDDDTLPDRIREQLTRKVTKLAKYPGMTKILLVESEDGFLMNQADMLTAICKAFPDGLPVEVDQLWYADTSIHDSIEFLDFTTEIRARIAQRAAAPDRQDTAPASR